MSKKSEKLDFSQNALRVVMEATKEKPPLQPMKLKAMASISIPRKKLKKT